MIWSPGKIPTPGGALSVNNPVQYTHGDTNFFYKRLAQHSQSSSWRDRPCRPTRHDILPHAWTSNTQHRVESLPIESDRLLLVRLELRQHARPSANRFNNDGVRRIPFSTETPSSVIFLASCSSLSSLSLHLLGLNSLFGEPEMESQVPGTALHELAFIATQ